MADSSLRAQMRAATRALWQQVRDTELDRVTAIESAVLALINGCLADDERVRAEREAHKIAGSAGTFGMHRASEIARELELLLGDSTSDPETAVHAAALVEDLRSAVAAAALEELVDQPAATAEQAASRPVVAIVHLSASLAAAIAASARARGLVPEVMTDATLAQDAFATGTAPAAAVVNLPGRHRGGGNAHDLVRLLDQRGTAVIGVLPSGADTATRVTALQAGARLLLDIPTTTAAAAAKLIDAVASLVGASEQTPPRVLAVDDDQTVLLAVRDLLSRIGVQVETLDEPERFWSELSRVQPDLLLLDLYMPGMNGLQLCQMVRADTHWSQLPVVVLSGSVDAAVIGQVYAVGADDFVNKPVIGPELQARVTNRLERARLYRLLAETDPLTGIANRRRTEHDLDRLQHLADRYGTDLSLGVVDIDHFKKVNDQHGHAAGDEVLRRFAAHLREAFRGEDAVGRLGGEEFVVVMFGMGREDAVERLNAVLRSFASVRLDIEGASLSIRASAGVAQHRRDGVGFELLYRAADEALRTAKASGRGRVLPAGTSQSRRSGGIDIAIVEDDEVLAELFRYTLTTAGYRCAVLSDGFQAVQQLAGSDAVLRPAVVLLDIDLPGRNGFEVLHALNETDGTSRTAVVIVTARSSEAEVMRALRAGAADHIAKPFSVPLLVEQMRRLVPDTDDPSRARTRPVRRI